MYREYSKGLRTQSWVDPVFRVRGLEVCLPTLTTWGLAVRKSRTQAHRGVFRPSLISLPYSLLGTMVLKAQLKSINHILTFRTVNMREGAVYYLEDSIVCGHVWPVGRLHVEEAVLGTGTLMDNLKQAGTTDSARERLNIVVNTGASWLGQVFNTRPNMPSGPAAFLVFTFIRTLLTSCSVTERVCSFIAMELTSATVPVLLLAST